MCVSGTGQNATYSYAAVKVAQIMSSVKECASGMEQRSNNVAVKVAQTKLRKEEFALDMGQRSNDAAARDAQIKLSVEECATGMGHIPSLRTNLPHFHYHVDQLSMKQP